MKILLNSGGIAMTNCFVIADENAGEAAMFDAPNDTTGELLAEVRRRGWNLLGLYLTHGHFDHIADHAIVSREFPAAKVAIHRLDEYKLQHPEDTPFDLPFVIPARSADRVLEDGDEFRIGQLVFQVIHTPGHSVGHCVFYCAREAVLVGGDLIIGGSVGRTDLPDSCHADLEASIRRVMKLPGQTRLLPGHGSTTTLDHERMTNLYVQEALANV